MTTAAVQFYNTNRVDKTKHWSMPHMKVVCSCLIRYSKRFWLPDPRGSSVASSSVLRFLHCQSTKNKVHEQYCTSWDSMVDGGLDSGEITTLPKGPLSEQKFDRARSTHFSELKIWRLEVTSVAVVLLKIIPEENLVETLWKSPQ